MGIVLLNCDLEVLQGLKVCFLGVYKSLLIID